MAFVNLKKNLNHVGSILKSSIEKDNDRLLSFEKKTSNSMKVNENNYKKYINILNANLNSDDPDNNLHIPKFKLASNKTLLVFLHDSFSPFLGEKMENYSKKLKFLKKILEINNNEQWENARLEDVFSPWEKHIPPRVSSDNHYRTLGTYTHITTREKAHVGFMTVMAQCALPIETNSILQMRLENTYNPNETKNCEKPKIAEAILKDTTYNRLVWLQKAIKSFAIQLLAYTTEQNRAYSDIYILINPICSSSNPDTNHLLKMAHVTLGDMFLGGLKLHVGSKVTLVTLNDLVYHDECQYTPGKKRAEEMKLIVSYIYICVCVSITVLVIYYLRK